MSPESRAQATYERIKHELTIAKHAFGEDAADVRWDIITHYVASALRQAENDGIERAAVAALNEQLSVSAFVDAVDCRQFDKGVRAAVAAIRALIHKEP